MDTLVDGVQDKPRTIHVGVFSPNGHYNNHLIHVLTGYKDCDLDTAKAPTQNIKYTPTRQLGHEFVFYAPADIRVTRSVGSGFIKTEVLDNQKVSTLMANANRFCPHMDLIILAVSSRITVENESLFQALSRFKLPILLLICDVDSRLGSLSIEHATEYSKYQLFPNACLYVESRCSENEHLDAAFSPRRMLSAKLVWYQLAIIAESILWKEDRNS